MPDLVRIAMLNNAIKVPFRLEVDLPDDRLGHVLILPRAAVDLLELNAMQTQQWDLDNEDLKSQSHTGAEIALHVGAGFACGALLSR